MGSLPSKQDEKLHHINKEVNSLRSSLRGSRRSLSKDSKEEYIHNLAIKSGEASSLRGKVKQKKLDQAIKNISQTMNEVLTITPRDSQLDMATVETNSFVQVPISQRRSFPTVDSAKSKNVGGAEENLSKSNRPTKSNNKSIPTLRDIETKLNSMKPKIDYALNEKDSKQLRFYEQTLRLLAGDLEIIPADERKKKIEKQLSASYQRVAKAHKQIKRGNDIHYLSGQNRKEAIYSQLQQIEKNIQESEECLQWALENKDIETMLKIKENLILNNKKLTDVELLDDYIKEEDRRLTAKAVNMVNTIENIVKLNVFEKDIALAETKYQQLIADIQNSGNKEDLSKKLRNLKKFVGDLEPFDNDSKTKKENLFNLVERTLFNVISSLKKVEDQKTVADIVEENVILRNKQKRDLIELEKFYSHWRNVIRDFNVNSYSKDALLKIDAILQEMQISIIELRREITLHNNVSSQNLPVNPKLSSFGSCQSLDDTMPGIIKVKTKYYNISSPELKHTGQPNIDFYEYDSSVFSKIEEIKTQVYYLKEKINECQNTQHLKNKLESYVQILKKYLFHRNQTIANNAKIVTNDVNDLLSDLSNREKVPSRRISIEDNFEDIVGIQESLEALEKEVQTFYGDRNNKNFERLKLALLDCKSNLERIRVSPRYEMVQQQKQELLKNCSSLVSILEQRAANYSIYEENVLRERRKSLEKLKEKVDRFSGTYKGVLYNKIEMDLNKLLLQVNEDIESKDAAQDINKTAEKYLKILEQRSSKAQSFRDTIKEELRSSVQINMSKIKNDLIGIKKEIDLTPDSNAEAFIRLKSRLGLVNLELDQIGTKSNEALEKDKEIFANEAQTLKNYVEAKIALASQRPSQNLIKKSKTLEVQTDPIGDLKNIEESFRLLKNEIGNFEGVHLDDKYFALDKDLHGLISRLDKYNFIRDTDLYTQKLNLLNELHQCENDLDRKAKEVEMIVEIEKDLEKIAAKFEKEKDKNLQEEKLKYLKEAINSIEVPINLEKRKKACLDQAISLLEKAKKENENDDYQKLTEIEDLFKKIKPEINVFVGLQNDTKFIELDEITMKLILKLDKYEFPKTSTFNQKKLDLLKELHMYNGLLDERAKQTENIIELERILTNIDSLIDNFSGNEDDRNNIKDKIKHFQQKLNAASVSNELIERKNNCRQKFSIIFNKFSMLDPNKVEVTGNSGYNSVVYNFTKTTKQDLEKISKTIDKITENVEQFSNVENSEEYQAIDDVLNNLTLELNRLDISRDNDLYDNKIALMGKIQRCTDILDEKAQEIQSVIKIEEELEDVNKKILGEISEDMQNNMDEKLIQLQVKIGRLSVSKHLIKRKEQCSEILLKLMKKMKEDNERPDSFDSGTQI